MKIVSLIPARGGSKRLPDKNIRVMCSKPLIAHSIVTSKLCNQINETWVSTNCPKIVAVSKEAGALVLKRPKELCTDTATSEEALLHFAERVEFDILVFIQATSPLTVFRDIEKGLSYVTEGKADSVVAVMEDNRFYWDVNRRPVNYDPLNRPRTQDKEKWYKETGAFYITTRDALLKSKCRISGKIEFAIMPESRSFEVDTMEDFELIESMMLEGKHI